MDETIGWAQEDGAPGQPLVGGNSGPVVRMGDTVRRVTGEWTPAVHALLNLLEDAGVDGVPRARGLDELGREIVTYVPGDTMADAEPGVLWAEGNLVAAAQLMRRMHDASRSLVDDGSRVWRTASIEPREVICHNDFAPYNLIVRDGALVGAIDFDYASPGPRVWDLAYLAYRLVPFAEDAPAADGLSREDRLRKLIAAYGTDMTPDQLRRVITARLDTIASFTRDRARLTGRGDFLVHAAMYERDAAALRHSPRSERT